VTYEDTDRLAMRKLIVQGEYRMELFDGHRIAVATKGSGKFQYNGGEKQVRPGSIFTCRT